MKKIFLFALTISLLTACGKSKSGTDLGQEVCDCSKKANAMDPADPKRAEAQKDCGIKQVEAWNKVKDDQKKELARKHNEYKFTPVEKDLPKGVKERARKNPNG